MAKTLPLLLSLLSGLSFAGGEHAGDHHSEKVTSAGIPGHSADVSRTIEVVMGDNMRFSPSQINVEAGETIRFSIKNTGQLKHEFVIGNAEELKAHAQMMLTMPDMQHQDSNMIS
ncbi:MAG TPA: cupredoxin domain-containing protein, partial [Psychromonas sp.]